MAITNDEKQTIINAVISAIRTNSQTIDQLSPVTSLAEDDSFEINGGKRVSYGVLRELILSVFNDNQDELKSLIARNELNSVTITTTEDSATLTISSVGKTIRTSIPIASDAKAGLMSVADKEAITSAGETAVTANTTANLARTKAETAQAGVDTINSKIGVAGGIATLDNTGRIPARFIPDAYDDVKEFGSFVNDVSASESTEHSSTDPGCMVVYDTAKNKFLLAVAFLPIIDEDWRLVLGRKSAIQSTNSAPSKTELSKSDIWLIDDETVRLDMSLFSYYKNWADSAPFGTQTILGCQPVEEKLYVNTSTNSTYRWSGNTLVSTGSDLALGHTPNTAFPGNEGESLLLSVNDLQGQFYNLESKLRGISILPFDGFYDEYPDQSYGVWFRYSDDENGGQAYMWAEEYPDGYSFDDYNITFRGFSVIRPDRLYRCGNKIYKVVGKVLYEFVTMDQLLESLASMKQTIHTEIDELHEEINEYADDAAQAEAQNVKTSIGIQEFAGIAGSQGSCNWISGETYWIAADKCFMRDHAVVWTDKENTPLRTQLYRCKNDLYRVVKLEGKQYELYKLVSTDELEGAVEPVAKELSRKARIITFDGKYEDLEEAEWIDGNIYWIDGEGFYECKEVDGEQQYVALYPDGYDTIQNNCLFTDGDYLYWVCGGSLTRIAEGWEIEDLTNGVVSLSPRIDKLFLDLWENYLTVWTPFGGVSSGLFPHASMKLGGISENGKPELFGVELTIEEAMAVLSQPDPMAFGNLECINSYFQHDNTNGLSVPRLPYKDSAVSFDITTSPAIDWRTKHYMVAPLARILCSASGTWWRSALLYYVQPDFFTTNSVKLKELYLVDLPTRLNLSNCPDITDRCVARLIRQSTEFWGSAGIIKPCAITLHSQAYDNLSEETLALAANSNGLVTLIRNEN